MSASFKPVQSRNDFDEYTLNGSEVFGENSCFFHSARYSYIAVLYMNVFKLFFRYRYAVV